MHKTKSFSLLGFHKDNMGEEILSKLAKHVKDYSARLDDNTSASNSFRRSSKIVENQQGGSDTNQMQQNTTVGAGATSHRSETSRATNFTVVDWGTVMSKRSFGEDRIVGDLGSHYGLEARLLFAQQLLHHLLATERRISMQATT